MSTAASTASMDPDARRAIVISPHRDDAAFSVGATSRWLLSRGVHVVIVSCFTYSDWAPCLPQGTSAEDITRIRSEEDAAYVRLLGEAVTLVSLGLPDRPLRPDRSPYKTWPEVDTHPLPQTWLTRLRSLLEPFLSASSAWLVPLALEHPDHVIAREAALAAAARAPLMFYEDVPYVFWFSEDDVGVRARVASDRIGNTLRPRVLHESRYLEDWLEGVCCYKSQFSHEQVESMGRVLAVRGGERAWVTPEFEKWCGDGTREAGG